MRIVQRYKSDQVRALISQNSLSRVVATEMKNGEFTLTFFPKSESCLAADYESDRGEIRLFKTVNAAWAMARKLGIEEIGIAYRMKYQVTNEEGSSCVIFASSEDDAKNIAMIENVEFNKCNLGGSSIPDPWSKAFLSVDSISVERL
jgi:hypothetical protein